MSDDEPRVSRRSVLKTTGAALGVGVGATGTAAAACNKVRVKNDYYLLQACGGEATPFLVERGTELYVYETCDPSGDATGPIYYRIECGCDLWIEDRHVECIAGTTPPCFEA